MFFVSFFYKNREQKIRNSYQTQLCLSLLKKNRNEKQETETLPNMLIIHESNFPMVNKCY